MTQRKTDCVSNVCKIGGGLKLLQRTVFKKNAAYVKKKQWNRTTKIRINIIFHEKEKSYQSSVYFWPYMLLTSRYQPFWPITTLFTCRFAKAQRLFTCKHSHEKTMVVWHQRHHLTLNADWSFSDLFFARRIDLTILHSTIRLTDCSVTCASGELENNRKYPEMTQKVSRRNWWTTRGKADINSRLSVKATISVIPLHDFYFAPEPN